MFDLKGRVAVVTGAGSGIGASVAETLYQQNAHVVLIARTEEKVLKVAKGFDPDGKRTTVFTCDVADEAALTQIRDKIVGSLGKIDILVTCAAAPAAAGKTEELSLKDWRSLMTTDLDGVFLCCKTFGGEMVRRKYGRIINLTSFHCVATYPNRAAYNAAKSGVEGLSRALAVEWGHYGITVNTIAPGPIRTPRTSWFLSQSPENEAGMLARTPSVRLGETEDVAKTIAFLVSEEAKHINGQQIVLDGGWTKNAWWGKHTDLT